MSSDALAVVAGVAFLLAVLAVVFIPIVIIAKKRGRRPGGDTNHSSSMNDINNLNF